MKRITTILMISLALFTMMASEAVQHHHHGEKVCYDIGHCCPGTHSDSHDGASCGHSHDGAVPCGHSDSGIISGDGYLCEAEEASGHDSGCEHCGGRSCNAHVSIFVVPAAESKAFICNMCDDGCGHADMLLFSYVIPAIICPPPVGSALPDGPDISVPLPADFAGSSLGLRAPPVA